MKEWISNKKNQPIVIGIVAVVVLLGVAAILFETGVFGGGSGGSVPVATSPPPSPAMPAAATGAAPTANLGSTPSTPPSATPAAPPTAAPAVARAGKPGGKKATLVASAVTASASRNPFQPKYSVAALKPPAPRVLGLFPYQMVATYLPPVQSQQPPPLPPIATPTPANVQLGRVSGIILSNGVHAIYEANGQSSILQPGDELPDDTGRVQSIQSDGITIRLADNRLVQLPVTAGNNENRMGYPGGPMGYPGGGPMGYPGGPPAGYGAPPPMGYPAPALPADESG